MLTDHEHAASATSAVMRAVVWSLGLIIVLVSFAVFVRPELTEVWLIAGGSASFCVLLTGPLLAWAVRFPLATAAPAVLALAGLRAMTMLLVGVGGALIFDAPWRSALLAGVPLYFVLLAAETVPLARLFWTFRFTPDPAKAPTT